jgi:hypothetical protein
VAQVVQLRLQTVPSAVRHRLTWDSGRVNLTTNREPWLLNDSFPSVTSFPHLHLLWASPICLRLSVSVRKYNADGIHMLRRQREGNRSWAHSTLFNHALHHGSDRTYITKYKLYWMLGLPLRFPYYLSLVKSTPPRCLCSTPLWWGWMGLENNRIYLWRVTWEKSLAPCHFNIPSYYLRT